MKHLRTILSVLAAAAAISCSKTNGFVSFDISSDLEITEVTRSNVSQYTALPSAGDFVLSVTGTSYTWTGKLSDWDATAALAEGSYTVTAAYGNLEDEGFDKPYFTSKETSFTVKGGEQSAVKVDVALGNTIVLVSCTDAFKEFYPEYTFTLTREGAAAPIAVFAKDETRGAFVDGYKLTVNGQLTGHNGAQVAFKKDYTNLAAATAYTCLFDINKDSFGGVSLTIEFNDTVETIDLGDYELND